MASDRDLGPRDPGDGTDAVTPPHGYALGEGRSMEDVLEIEAQLLESEGIDPTWPGFDADRRRQLRRDRPDRNS